MDKVKAAVVGVGHLGSRHARIYSELPGVDLVGVVDTDFDRAGEVARQYRTRPLASIGDIPSEVEAVSVVVPTNHHYDISLRLLEMGFNLLLEKPITETDVQARELLKLAEKENLLIQVGHVERFNPAVLALEKILKEPRFIECQRHAPYQLRGTEVGVVLDLMIHDLDIILHLVSSPLESVEAIGMPILSRSEDIAHARLKFKNGCVANLFTSRVSPQRLRRLNVFQDDAYISVNYMKQRARVYRKDQGEIVFDDLPVPKGEPLKMEISSFIESVRLGGRPQVPAEHGLEALTLAMAIIKEVGRSQKKIKKLQRLEEAAEE